LGALQGVGRKKLESISPKFRRLLIFVADEGLDNDCHADNNAAFLKGVSTYILRQIMTLMKE